MSEEDMDLNSDNKDELNLDGDEIQQEDDDSDGLYTDTEMEDTNVPTNAINALFRSEDINSSNVSMYPQTDEENIIVQEINNEIDDEFTLFLLLQPDNIRHRVFVTFETTLKQVKHQIYQDLKVSPVALSFPEIRMNLPRTAQENDMTTDIKDIERQEDEVQLKECQLSAKGMQLIVAVDLVKDKDAKAKEYVLPNQIHVQIYNEKTKKMESFTVEISKFEGKKVYLGGYKHRINGKIYHHASTQTIVSRARVRAFQSNKEDGVNGTLRDIPRPQRYERTTQTQILVTCSMQTLRESGTQMARKDLYMDTTIDRTIIPSTIYFDSFQKQNLQEESALVIQRMWRGYIARLYVYYDQQNKHKLKQLAQQNTNNREELDRQTQKQEINRRIHPSTVSDFEILYNELEKWREVELRKLNDLNLTTSTEKQAYHTEILAKETKLLQTIDRLKATATMKNKKQRIEAMLQVLSRPKQWEMSDGSITKVETQYTIRAKELRELYHGLNLPHTTIKERLDILLHIKWTVMEFQSPLIREIIELIDRESDMLNRGRQQKTLKGLRKRISNLFLTFIETPEYNPEVTIMKLLES